MSSSGVTVIVDDFWRYEMRCDVKHDLSQSKNNPACSGRDPGRLDGTSCAR